MSDPQIRQQIFSAIFLTSEAVVPATHEIQDETGRPIHFQSETERERAFAPALIPDLIPNNYSRPASTFSKSRSLSNFF